MGDLGKNLHDIDWAKEQPIPFQKVFFKQGKSRRTPEEIEEYRKKHLLQVRAEPSVEVPYPFVEWKDTHFPDYIMKAVEIAGFDAPTSIQAQAFPILLSGNDLIGIAQTGSGKTCAFLLPGIVHINAQPTVKRGDGPIVLVLAPTRELAMQIQTESEKFGKTCKLISTCIYGGVEKYHQRKALENGLDMVIATPGRLIDFLEQGATNLRRVTYLVLDEADRMLDMGFEPQIRKICGQIRPDRQTMMFTATWPKEVRQLARDLCHEQPIHIQIGSNDMTINKNIKQEVYVVPEHEKRDRLVKALDEFTSDDKVLIFCATKKGSDNLSSFLSHEGFYNIAIHGDKSQRDRDRALDEFRSNRKRIMIATDVASRGLDIRDVTYVINYDFPKAIDDYVHRIGRTGRAGDKGTSISFIDPDDDGKIVRDLIQMLTDAGQQVPPDVQDLSNSVRRSYGGGGGGGYRGRGGRGGRGGGSYNGGGGNVGGGFRSDNRRPQTAYNANGSNGGYGGGAQVYRDRNGGGGGGGEYVPNGGSTFVPPQQQVPQGQTGEPQRRGFFNSRNAHNTERSRESKSPPGRGNRGNRD